MKSKTQSRLSWCAVLLWRRLEPLIFSAAWRYVLSGVVVLSMVSSFAMAGQLHLLAQQPEPFLEVTGVNTDAFPTMQITVSGEGLAGGLADAQLTLLEDGVAQTITQSDNVQTGSQLLIALDSSSNIMAPYKGPIVDAVQDLIDQQILLVDKDWLAFIAFDHADATVKPSVLQPWNASDHGAVVNGLVTYDPPSPKSITPLNELLRAAIQYFDEVPAQNLARSIVVFTDGFNPLTVTEKEDIFRDARARRVHIHTVQLGSTPNGEQHLRNIAQNTNGLFTRLDRANPQLNELWQTFQRSQTQQVLTYRTARPGPKQVTVQVTNGARLVEATGLIAPFPVLPPQMTIVSPGATTLEKVREDGQPLTYDTPVNALGPKTLELSVEVAWPDGYPRNLQQVEYVIGDRTIVQSTEPLTTVAFPVDTFDQGEYTLRVRGKDELGLVGDYTIQPLNILVNRPEPPDLEATTIAVAINAEATTAALQATQAGSSATSEARQAEAAATTAALNETLVGVEVGNQRLTLATIISSFLALFALAFALYIWFNPRARRAATEFAKGAYATMTQMWTPGGMLDDAVKTIIKARLIYEGGAQSPQPDIELYGGSTRMGRDPVLANVVISDQRISRYHCRISEEANGTFLLRDEGSTSGTFVNNVPVTMSGRTLSAGDLINLGPVKYRFEPLGGSVDTPTQIGTMEGGMMATQPYLYPGADNQPNNDFYEPNTTQIDTVPYAEEDPNKGALAGTQVYGDTGFDMPTQIGPVDDSQATKT